MRRHDRGQSTAEYAIVISVVIAAVLGMQLYMKRGMQGKVKDGVDFFTNQEGTMDSSLTNNISNLDQYEPYYAESNTTTNQSSSENEQMLEGGRVFKGAMKTTTHRTGNQIQGVGWNPADANWTTRHK